MEKATETVEIIDYALPTMMAERALKDMHNAALDRKWAQAQKHALEAIRWATEAHATLLVARLKEQPRE